ncbi:MAG TPA: thiolase family protein [Steroidobacteraceae bacterium]|jgi:acetyl-CoA C-acetyltransferase|nr:thiolase family protein [Steroidobacteraceae bacterium]
MRDSPVIAAARRTPIGAFQGALAGASGTELGAAALRAALADCGAGGAVEEVLLGCVLPAGLGQAPARQAAIAAGVATNVPATTVNKVCGSGMKALMLGAEAICAGSVRAVAAGGFESMSNAPYLLPKARQGYRMGHGQLLDHMLYDGLQNPADGELMGHFADVTARKFGFSRAEQDQFAAESVRRALAAVEGGAFQAEITPVTVRQRGREQRVEQDEPPFKCDLAKMPMLKPAFDPDGTVTAASSSSIADGAAALVLMSEAAASAAGAPRLARLVAWASFAQAPEWFTTAPAGAIRRVLERAGWRDADVDLYEVNEAFAVVTMAAIRELTLDPARVNVHGGACALGHPIGASGARIVTTLLHALRRRGGGRGVAALCIGGGEATAVALEVLPPRGA